MAARAVLTTRNMATEDCGTAGLDCAHHLQLPKAQVTAVGMPPRGAVIAEYIRDLQDLPVHRGWPLPRRRLRLGADRGQPVERAHDLADDVGCNLCIARGRIELGVP